MQEKTVTLNNASGLHARPAKEFVSEAKTFSSSVTLVKGGNEYNGKSLMKILQGGFSQGDEILIRTEGDDEVEALEKLADFIANLAE